MKTVLDYIIEQADRYDIKNMQFEEDILLRVKRATSENIARICRTAGAVDSTLKLSTLMISIDSAFTYYNSTIKKILMDKFSEYAKTGYDNTGDLIELGKEIEAKLSTGIREQKASNEYDEETIDFIQKHAFEQITGYSNQKIEKIRATLTDMLLKGNTSKAQIREALEKLLNVGKSKAEEITQQELSRAYNYGTIAKLKEYQRMTGERIRKYWHGFKYSAKTCEYCRPRIGSIYELDDETESLPAHIRCRCIWLPILGNWDEPVNTSLIARANMLNTAYSKEMMYQRIENRLNIKYSNYLDEEAVTNYLSGDRSQKVINALKGARQEYINDLKDSFNISPDTSNGRMSKEFNTQMNFWKDIVAGAKADNDDDLLRRSIEGIKGVMLLPWNAEQLEKWNDLLSKI